MLLRLQYPLVPLPELGQHLAQPVVWDTPYMFCLVDQTNTVITHDVHHSVDGARVCHSFEIACVWHLSRSAPSCLCLG